MSSDGEGPARSSASPARRENSGGSNRSQSPSGAVGGNSSDNDAGSLGSDAGKGNNDDEDLFGSESEGGDDKPAPRRLDDEELDSGDDQDRYDRTGDPMDYEQGDEGGYGETLNVMDLGLGRVPEPESQDGEVYTMNVPNFLTIESEDFNPETYVPPPFNTAATSLCWRTDPKDDSKIQSNSRIIRWSDGSLTLQLASSPQEQYRMPSKRLAPKANVEYEPDHDAHTYLGAAAETSSVFRITSHLKSSLVVLPTAVESDDAVERLKQSLAAATRGTKKNADGSVAMFDVKEDPELAKKQAELAEREKLRAARKRQAAAERDLDRGRRVGLSSRSGGAGLTVGGLEDDMEGMATTKARGAQKSRRANRRGEIYSDEDEGYGRRGGQTREDEYDEDDGFLVGSDEEPEIVDDADEEEEEEDEDEDADGEPDDEAKPSRDTTRKNRTSEENRAPEDTEMAGTGGAGSPPVRKKNRYIVDDDEDDE